MAITGCDIPVDSHEETLKDLVLVEFALDYGLSFVQVTPETFEVPINRIIASIRGYSTPTSLTKIKNIYQHSAAVWCMEQSGNGDYLYSGSMDGTVRIWDIQSSVCVAILLYHTEQIYKLKEHNIILSRDWCKPCRLLIACSGDCACSVWLLHRNFYSIPDDDMPFFRNNPLFVLKHNERIKSFEVCNNHVLCTAADDNRIRLWSLIDGTLLYDTGDIGDTLNQIVYVKEYDKLFASSRKEYIYSLHLQTHGAIFKLTGGHHNNINELRICRKNKKEIYLISVDESGYIRCWNTRNPKTDYVDFVRHDDSINAISICTVNGDKSMACTASRDRTIRGYSIPDGQILFNINDSEDTLRAIDCNAQYVICGGKDSMIRCYKFFSNQIQYPVDRNHIKNPLNVSLQWAYQRHEGYLNRIMCGKKQYRNIVFSGERNGIVLGWDLDNNGECVYCFGSEEQYESTIKGPKSEVRAEIITMIVQFMQLATSVFLVYGEDASEEVELSAYGEDVVICVLLVASLVLCIAILIKPPFYFRNMNIFNAALFFGVLWTDLWSLFVISEEKVRDWGRLRRWSRYTSQVDNIKAIGHLAVLIPFMILGALLMHCRINKNKYDEIRGEFRDTLHHRNIGIVSENTKINPDNAQNKCFCCRSKPIVDSSDKSMAHDATLDEETRLKTVVMTPSLGWKDKLRARL
eukprot:565011_1